MKTELSEQEEWNSRIKERIASIPQIDEQVKSSTAADGSIIDEESAGVSFVECPICKGTGLFALPYKMATDTAEIKERIAKELHAKGYSVRQIMKALGYKSPRSVQLFLKP